MRANVPLLISVSLGISASERFPRPFPRFLILDAKFDAISPRRPSPVAAVVSATPPATFPGKRRTLEILARNVGSGGRVTAVETPWGVEEEGRPPRLGGISFPWRLPANATLPPYRGRRRRHRRRRVCSCSCAPWFRFRYPPFPPPPSPVSVHPPGARRRPGSSFHPRPRANRVLPLPLSDVLLSLPFVPPLPPPPRHPALPSSAASAGSALPSNSSATPVLLSLTLPVLLPLIVSSLMQLHRKLIV